MEEQKEGNRMEEESQDDQGSPLMYCHVFEEADPGSSVCE